MTEKEAQDIILGLSHPDYLRSAFERQVQIAREAVERSIREGTKFEIESQTEPFANTQSRMVTFSWTEERRR